VAAVRILLWLVALMVLAAGAAWLADHPGALVIDWGSYRIETSAAATAALLVVFILVLILFGRAVGWIARGSPALRESRRRRGYKALTSGLVAVAEGDGANARRLAKRAKSLIKEKQPLTTVLLAQVAQLDGDEQAARRYFTLMLDNPDTEYLGLRGLIVDANRHGDTTEALKLARRAQEVSPNAPWLLSTVFELETREGLWQDAQKTLERSRRKRLVTPDDARRRKALVMFQRAREETVAGDDEAALDCALRASGFAHDFVPAAALAARLVAPSRPRKAARIVERTWRTAPHPDLAAAYAEIYADDLPARRAKRFIRLSGMNLYHPESRLAVAAQALEAGLWGVAWNNLRPLVEDGVRVAPGARACRLMARYEREGNDDPSAAQEWDSRAAGINDRLAWRCADCGRESPDWEPVCAGCNGFDTLGWRGVVEIVPVPGTITVEAGEGPPPAPLDDGPDAAPRRSDSQG
jgi:HemY protein